jgi:hypothetical protein
MNIILDIVGIAVILWFFGGILLWLALYGGLAGLVIVGLILAIVWSFLNK